MGRRSFTELMTLAPLDGDRFRAPLAPETRGTMFGGQFLAQGLMASQATVTGREPHSLHAYFLRPGAVDIPLELNVERVRDGRSFSARMVTAWQEGRELFRMAVSYHVSEPGSEYAGAVMPPVPPPEDVPLRYADFIRASAEPGKCSDFLECERTWDIRYIDPPTALPGEPVTDDQRMWMRLEEDLDEHPGLQQAALAYLSDATLIDQVLLPHGLRWEMSEVEGTSLDHAMWFLRPPRADEWLLLDQHVEATGNARGLATGRFFSPQGELVATCCQEGLVRWDSTAAPGAKPS